MLQAVRLGHFPDGFTHWMRHGRAEGRLHDGGQTAQPIESRVLPPYERLEEICDANNWTWLEYEHRGFTVKAQSPAETREILLAHARAVPPGGRIDEIGVFGGATLLHVAQTAEANRVSVVGIDPWGSIRQVNGIPIDERHSATTAFLTDLERHLRNVVEVLGYHHVHLLQTTSEEAAASFEDRSIDFLFLDGGHSFDEVRCDLSNYLPKVKRGGVIMGDDFDWPSVREAFETVRGAKDLRLSYEGRVGHVRVT